jgi:integrase
MLSGVFTFALREGVLDGVNPMRSVQIPGRPERRKQPVYSLKEVVDIIVALAQPKLAQSPARIVVTVAAFSGLRISEVRGLRWEDYDGESLHVRRAIWRTHVSSPKTVESEADVPVLKMVKTVLDVHRRANPDAQPHDYIFKGERRGFALNMANLATRVIKPALAERGLVWKGWHSFRRGLATNLYAVDASPKIIQSILRHSAISSVTMERYVQTTDTESRAALARLEDATKFPWM